MKIGRILKNRVYLSAHESKVQFRSKNKLPKGITKNFSIIEFDIYYKTQYKFSMYCFIIKITIISIMNCN